MAARLRPMEEFLVLFNNLKKAAGDTPERVVTFYTESKAVRDAVDALHEFLARTDFERRIVHGRKIVRETPGFQAAWEEYSNKWRFRVTRPEDVGPGIAFPISFFLDDAPLAPELLAQLDEQARRTWKESQVSRESPVQETELRAPDPETEDTFDPLVHDGGDAIELGVGYWEGIGQRESNDCSIALGAYDYLINTVGLDVNEVFRRWRRLPPIFMPARVSGRYGRSDRGSLPRLLDDAVRAYVFGAPAAAIAMCRAAYEMLRKEHFTEGQLENVIAHASAEYSFVTRDSIEIMRKRANKILHNYATNFAIGPEDERTIVNFLRTIKYLIENAPTA